MIDTEPDFKRLRFLRHPVLRRAFRKCLSKPLDEQRRSILDFASEEIIVPRGKYKGLPYNTRRKPASELWFNELDSRRWQIHNYTGPTQSGKTLDAFIIPILYCLFEKEENVIVGIPQMKMAMSKWKKDILPVLLRTRYRHYLPTKGRGSAGGEFNEVAFGNGVYLTFMSFGGDDKNRAGDTAPNLIITETDGANDIAQGSSEGTKIQQLMGRTLSYDMDAFIVMECTVTTDLGITWQTHLNGSEGRIVRPCPHCGDYVIPERDHFVGWNNQADEISAGKMAAFACPSCSHHWSDKERFEANKNSVLIHRGQTINKEGVIEGELPKTSTLGFRCSAVDNFLRTSEFLGRLMWKAERDEDKEAADRTIKQQQFAEPITNTTDELPPLKLYDVASRIVFDSSAIPDEQRVGTQQSRVPSESTVITIGTDVRKTQLHWVAIAWEPDATSRVIDYGIRRVLSRKYGFEVAVRIALRQMREVFQVGFMNNRGDIRHVDQWWIDVGWEPDPIYKFIKDTRKIEFWQKHCYPYVGRGMGKKYIGNYSHPVKEGGLVLRVIDQAHKRYNVKQQCPYWMVNADYYKVFVHNRLRIPLYVHELDDRGQLIPIEDYANAELNRGAMSLFEPRSGDHLDFVRQILSEHQETIYIQGKGDVPSMVTTSQANHFLDATYVACTAAVDCGITTSPSVITQSQLPAISNDNDPYGHGEILMPDGRVF